MTSSVTELPTVRRRAQVPVWRQIETDLAVDIRNGLYGPGDKLPSEQELSERYSVNRHTVRVALAKLSDDGLIVSHRGKGVFVADEPFEYHLTRDAKWSEVEQHLDTTPAGALIDSYERKASKRLAGLLAVDEGAELIVTESVRTASLGVATYGYHTFEKRRFEGLDKAFARTESFTTALAEYGISSFFRASSWIDCRLPRLREAYALSIPLEAPVLVMTYVDCDADGRPILFGHAVLPSGRFRIRVDTTGR